MSAQGGHSRDRVASQQLSVGGAPGGRRRPAQKTFAGYREGDELTTTGSGGTPRAVGAARARRGRNHPWLDYPPDFERKVERALGALARAPALALSPLPPAARFALARNFGFVAKTFTQFFDKDGVQSVQESIGLGK
jgi:hypothetical protein